MTYELQYNHSQQQFGEVVGTTRPVPVYDMLVSSWKGTHAVQGQHRIPSVNIDSSGKPNLCIFGGHGEGGLLCDPQHALPLLGLIKLLNRSLDEVITLYQGWVKHPSLALKSTLGPRTTR